MAPSARAPGNGGKANERSVTLRVSYDGIDDLPIHFANAYIIQKTPRKDEFIVSFGHLAPPVLLGTPEEMEEQANALRGVIHAKMTARFAMNSERLEELVSLLGRHLTMFKNGKLG